MLLSDWSHVGRAFNLQVVKLFASCNQTGWKTTAFTIYIKKEKQVIGAKASNTQVLSCLTASFTLSHMTDLAPSSIRFKNSWWVSMIGSGPVRDGAADLMREITCSVAFFHGMSSISLSSPAFSMLEMFASLDPADKSFQMAVILDIPSCVPNFYPRMRVIANFQPKVFSFNWIINFFQSESEPHISECPWRWALLLEGRN